MQRGVDAKGVTPYDIGMRNATETTATDEERKMTNRSMKLLEAISAAAIYEEDDNHLRNTVTDPADVHLQSRLLELSDWKRNLPDLVEKGLVTFTYYEAYGSQKGCDFDSKLYEMYKITDAGMEALYGYVPPIYFNDNYVVTTSGRRV